MNDGTPLDFSFEDAERVQLRAWSLLSADVKIDFFEEMVELAWLSSALAPDRLALRDKPIELVISATPQALCRQQ
ncbi:hypothetical protein [Thermomonas sp.]|uniref:hypothetical protein n=1 Tax=Thermomonas sp. TaxID=1971895 RepID=UPI0024875B48|nr:hypothetical protein [Thermomonas sp.]MDI1253198.1 hypothetical protein [Thermomonas sp.]